MSSSDRLNPQQLRMFIPAGELRDTNRHVVHSLEIQPGIDAGSVHKVYDRKLREAKVPEGTETDIGVSSGTHQKIKEQGVHTPIRLVSRPDLHEQEEEGIIRMPASDSSAGDYQSLIRDGMHRIASAADIDPKMEVPVQWERNVHWEHDTDDSGRMIPGQKGRPADPPPPPPPPDPWDDADHKWIDRSKSGSSGYHWANQYRTTRDDDTGQVGTEWEHYGPTASDELRPTGQPISEKTLARLRDPDDLGDG
jgi:hypothetical protein